MISRCMVLIASGCLLPVMSCFAGDAGQVLIADQFNNRIIEVDRSTHQILWQFGDGSDVPGAHSVVGSNDAVRFGDLTLISGTGIPVANPPLPGCSNVVSGCPDNRVLIVDRHGDIVWQIGKGGVTGAGFNELNSPVHAVVLPDFPHHSGRHIMITDQGNSRVIVVNLMREIIWQYGMTGKPGMGRDQLNVVAWPAASMPADAFHSIEEVFAGFLTHCDEHIGRFS